MRNRISLLDVLLCVIAGVFLVGIVLAANGADTLRKPTPSAMPVLYTVVTLYSGGQAVREWQAENIEWQANNGLWFTEAKTGRAIRVHGDWVVEPVP